MSSPSPPLDTAALRRVGGSMGSNPAGIFEDEHGQRFYIKSLESSAHAKNERIAAALYALAGAPTLTYVPTKGEGQVATLLVALEKRHVSQLDEAERKQAQRWFGVHAGTANWDAAGFEGDNQGVIGGRVVTLDVGGALEFRGQGLPKGKAFGTRVDELDTLRSEPDNRFALHLFADMDEATLREAILVVTQLPDAHIRSVIMDNAGSAALADKLLARKADMQRRLQDLAARG
jgi:hypothetical protein